MNRRTLLEARCFCYMCRFFIWGSAFALLWQEFLMGSYLSEYTSIRVTTVFAIILAFAWGIWTGTLPAYCLCRMLPEPPSLLEKFHIYSWSCRWPLWGITVTCFLRAAGGSSSLIAAVPPLFTWAVWAHACDTHGIDWESF